MIENASAISPKEIAVSGLRSQRTRMNVIANNVANALTTRTPQGGAFRRQLAVFRGNQLRPALRADKFGVEVSRIKPDISPLRPVYNPGHPDANAEGYVNYPNVDVAVEMADLVSSQRAYEANVAVIVSASRMGEAAMDIIRV